jgi:hypothetical protein
VEDNKKCPETERERNEERNNKWVKVIFFSPLAHIEHVKA